MRNSVIKKIIGVVIVLFLVEGIIFLGLFALEMKKLSIIIKNETISNSRSNQMQALKNLVNIAYSVVDSYYQKS